MQLDLATVQTNIVVFRLTADAPDALAAIGLTALLFGEYRRRHRRANGSTKL